MSTTKMSSEECMKMEHHYAAHNYHPLPVVIDHSQGVYVWDCEGKKYYDFLSAYSALNQGHNHPTIVRALSEQASKCALTSRAFYNSQFPLFAKYLTTLLGYDMMLPMNTGAEAVETAVKLARKWAYSKKGIKENEAIIINCTGCFHGRTLLACSLSDDPDCYEGFGPFVGGLVRIPHGDVNALKEVLEKHGPRVAGFILEPIQGEAGIKVPPEGYLAKCAELCKQHNCLLIADEVQTGLGRTGKMLCSEWDSVRPDVVCLGKALSGGIYPISAVCADKDIMLCIKPGQHGSTYGGNPIAAAVATAALKVLVEEKLPERAHTLGVRLRQALKDLNSPYIIDIRGRGLLTAIEVPANCPLTAWEICLLLMDKGLLCKPTHGTIIRLAPPLTMTEAELEDCISIFADVFGRIATTKKEEIPRRHL
jgi:ornithine--oxo-acid transaminase